MTANCFVNASISSRADEADDLVAIDDSNFALVADIWTDPTITRIYFIRSAGGGSFQRLEYTRNGGRREGNMSRCFPRGGESKIKYSKTRSQISRPKNK